MQQFNLDGAGEGNREIFDSNLEKWGVRTNDINRLDSMSITEDFIRSRENTYSYFSVDGCHTVEHTINDLKIALRMVKREGIIFIDDYYNEMWPGVQEGINKFYLMNSSNFIPLLFTCNKLFLCNISYHQQYFKAIQMFIKEHYPDSKMKKVKRFGYDTITVVPDWNSKKYVLSED